MIHEFILFLNFVSRFIDVDDDILFIASAA